jgi:hypothetical protein
MIKFSIIYFALSSLLSASYDCKDFQQGTFKLDDHKGHVSIIVRDANKQTDTNESNGSVVSVVEYKITWSDDCNYILSDRKIIKGEYKVPPQFANKNFHCRINKIDGNMHTVICKMEGGPEMETPQIEKIDHI